MDFLKSSLPYFNFMVWNPNSAQYFCDCNLKNLIGVKIFFRKYNGNAGKRRKTRKRQKTPKLKIILLVIFVTSIALRRVIGIDI